MTIRPNLTVVFFQFAIIGIVLSNTSSVLGNDSSQVRALISLVASDEAGQWDQAAKIFQAFPADSKWKAEASQAMAIIDIRQRKFSEAWKLLSGQSASVASAHASLRIGHEKLMLWLQLEANLADKTESQFQRLLTIATNKDTREFDRRDLCYFLGSVTGMLKSDQNQKLVAVATLDKTQTALESLESELAAYQFKLGLQAAEQWAEVLESRIQEFSTVGNDKSRSLLDSIQKELEEAIAKRLETKDDLREATHLKTALENEAKKLRANQKGLEKAWKTETPGRPREPSRPSQPRKPRTEYKKDSKTGQQVPDTNANRANEREYERDLAEYRSDLRRYESDKASYPARLAAWEQVDAARRDQLLAQKKAVDEELAAKASVVEKSRAESKEQLELSKGLVEAEKQARRSVAIASVAFQYSNSGNRAGKSLIRPSNFQLLDFESEVVRLEKCLSESPR
jgi:hypothetical protein